MDGNALIITVAMGFFWNLRGCSLVECKELELITSRAAPLRCYRPWLGGRQYYVDVFLLTLLEPCVSTNHFTASNNEHKYANGGVIILLGTHQLKIGMLFCIVYPKPFHEVHRVPVHVCCLSVVLLLHC